MNRFRCSVVFIPILVAYGSRGHTYSTIEEARGANVFGGSLPDVLPASSKNISVRRKLGSAGDSGVFCFDPGERKPSECTSLGVRFSRGALGIFLRRRERMYDLHLDETVMSIYRLRFAGRNFGKPRRESMIEIKCYQITPPHSRVAQAHH
jgi:hypothetical protein